MWRFWNCIPRVVRQQFHGPRASAGVCVEEEKAEHEVEKLVHDAADSIDSANGCQSHSPESPRTPLYICKEPCGGQEGDGDWGPERGQEGGTHHDHGGWWQRHCHEEFWARFCGQHRTLEAVTWGAAVVLGLQLSRRPNLDSYLDLLKDGEKRKQWQSVLFRMAFAMPPGSGFGVRRSLVEEPETQAATDDSKKGTRTKQPASVPEDTQTLGEVMQDFESSCRQYAAVGSSVSGVWAAERGDMTAALRHLQLACRLGHAPAYFNVAVCYQTGLGVEKDLKQAASYYKMAADVGHSQSIFNLALMTLKGEGGVVKDRSKGMKLVNKAAHNGLAQAQTYLGVYYTENEDDQQDFTQAASFFQAAASQNDSEGQYFLGICYENGWGVDCSDEDAARLYSSAAALGHDGAMYNMAAFHEHGLGGVERDEQEAMQLYQRSAKLGNESATFKLQEIAAMEVLRQLPEAEGTSAGSPSRSISTPAVAADAPQSQSLSPPGLRHSPHSSSPSLTDYLRDSLTCVLVGGLSAWPSSEAIAKSPSAGKATAYSDDRKTSDEWGKVTFFADERNSVCEEPRGRPSFCVGGGGEDRVVVHNVSNYFQDTGVPHGCLMHRTSTMPELRSVSRQ